MENRGCTVSCQPSLIFFIFLILKLTNTIDWSWWWITCPLWISVIFYLLFILLVFIYGKGKK